MRKPLILNVERVKGIEPSSSAWKTTARQDQAGRSRTDEWGGDGSDRGDVVPMPRRRRLYRLQFGEAASLRLITWGAFVFLRQLQRTFSHRGREQLSSLLLGLTHPLRPAKEMRARHRFHVPPMSVRPRRGAMTHTDQGHLVARVIAGGASSPAPLAYAPAWTVWPTWLNA